MKKREAIQTAEVLEGRNPILEALRAGRSMQRVWLADGVRGSAVEEIRALARRKGIPVHTVQREQIDRTATSRAHQGVIAWAAARSYLTLDALLERSAARDEPHFFLLLDGVEDPQNLGALMRTADAVGASGLVLPARRAAPLTASAIKASAGASEHLPVARVSNLVRAIDQLKGAGCWIAGATMDAEDVLWDVDLSVPIGVVVGGEGKGLRRLVREHCDLTVRLPMLGKVDSLNASVAGALMMYEVRRQRLRLESRGQVGANSPK